jgi:hypothetical protein
MELMKNYLERNFGYLIFSLLGFLSIPFMLYVFNAAEFDNDLTLLLIPLAVALPVVFFGALINLTAYCFIRTFHKANYPFQVLLSVVGLIIFINDVFVPTKMPALNGVLKSIPEPITLSLIEFCLALLIYTFCLLMLSNEKLRKAFKSVAVYAIIFNLSLGVFAIYLGYTAHQPQQKIQTLQTKNKVKSPNVYMIWLDGMQTDFFMKIVAENSYEGDFSGFTLFENNISNYLYSLQSYQSFMSGTYFKGGDYKAWGKDDRLRKMLKNKDYRFTTYSMPEFISEFDSKSLKTQDVVNERLQLKHPYISDFLSMSLVRMSPNFMANEALYLGKEISEQLIKFYVPDNVLEVNTVEKGMYPYSGPLTYEHMIEDEQSRQGTNEFILSQIIMPHGPYVLDKSCQYNRPKRAKSKVETYLKYEGQAHCAIKLVMSFFEELKKMKRYENSFIVVFGDHGTGWTWLSPKFNTDKLTVVNSRYSSWNQAQLLKRTSALLMIKPPKTEVLEPLKYSNKETQLVDILPTLLKSLNIKSQNSFDGRNVFSTDEKTRLFPMFYFKPQTIPNFDDAEVYSVDYESNVGRTKIKLLDTLSGFFNLKSLKDRSMLNDIPKSDDVVNRNNFD